jgi:hypothetical protein
MTFHTIFGIAGAEPHGTTREKQSGRPAKQP